MIVYIILAFIAGALFGGALVYLKYNKRVTAIVAETSRLEAKVEYLRDVINRITFDEDDADDWCE